VLQASSKRCCCLHDLIHHHPANAAPLGSTLRNPAHRTPTHHAAPCKPVWQAVTIQAHARDCHDPVLLLRNSWFGSERCCCLLDLASDVHHPVECCNCAACWGPHSPPYARDPMAGTGHHAAPCKPLWQAPCTVIVVTVATLCCLCTTVLAAQRVCPKKHNSSCCRLLGFVVSLSVIYTYITLLVCVQSLTSPSWETAVMPFTQ
jgi:hypothetical protein